MQRFYATLHDGEETNARGAESTHSGTGQPAFDNRATWSIANAARASGPPASAAAAIAGSTGLVAAWTTLGASTITPWAANFLTSALAFWLSYTNAHTAEAAFSRTSASSLDNARPKAGSASLLASKCGLLAPTRARVPPSVISY